MNSPTMQVVEDYDPNYDPDDELPQEAAPRPLSGDTPPPDGGNRGPRGPELMDADWDDEEPEIEPEICPVEGGRPLLYDGESHMIYGEGGKGKSWILYFIIAWMARQGRLCVLVDYESNRRTVRLRLKAMGVTKAEARYIAYWKVTSSLMPRQSSRVTLDQYIVDNNPAFIGLDSVAKCMGAAGMDESNPGQFVQWQQVVVEPWTARRITSVEIDHTGHQSDERKAKGSVPWARGASSKKDQVSGAAFFFEATQQWSRKNSGEGLLRRMKDREGYGIDGEVAARVVVTVADMGKHVDIQLIAPPAEAAPEDRKPFRPTWYMEFVSLLLADAGDAGLSMTGVERLAEDASKSKGHSRTAVKLLLAEGFVVAGDPDPARKGGVFHTLVRPYCTLEDPEVPDADKAKHSPHTPAF
jgi:AAA domain